MSTIGYIRVSTLLQNSESQKLAILQYCNKHSMKVNEWIEITISSRKSKKERRIDELLKRLKTKDILIVSELSRLGRSVGEISEIVDHLVKENIGLISIKESIIISGGKRDIQTKVMITMFSLFADIERDLLSERTKEGLIAARKKGSILGRPVGTIGKSKLDSKLEEIKKFREKGVNIANLAKIFDCHWMTMKNFVKKKVVK